MKKVLLYIAFVNFFFIMINDLIGQKYYFDLSGGYSFQISSVYDDQYSINPNTASEYELIKISYGDGININLRFGYLLDERVSLELGYNFLNNSLGGKNKRELSFEQNEPYMDYNFKRTSYALIHTIRPAIKFQLNQYRFDPYVRLGGIIGLGKITKKDYYYTDIDVHRVQRTEEFTGGFGIGVFASLGVKYEINENIKLFAETNVSNLSYAPTKSKFTEYLINGENQLGIMSVSEIETEYVNEYSSNSNSNPNDPSKAIKEDYPFSNLGIEIGINYSF